MRHNSCIGGVRSHTDNPGNTLRLADFILIFDTISTSENTLREFQFFCQSFRHRWEIFSYAGVFFLFNRKFHRNFLLNEKKQGVTCPLPADDTEIISFYSLLFPLHQEIVLLLPIASPLLVYLQYKSHHSPIFLLKMHCSLLR